MVRYFMIVIIVTFWSLALGMVRLIFIEIEDTVINS